MVKGRLPKGQDGGKWRSGRRGRPQMNCRQESKSLGAHLRIRALSRDKVEIRETISIRMAPSLAPDFSLLRKAAFPKGTNDWGPSNAVPDWPPDLFAFTATIAEHHGLYAEMEFSGGWKKPPYVFSPAYGARVSRAADAW